MMDSISHSSERLRALLQKENGKMGKRILDVGWWILGMRNAKWGMGNAE
jgi:hypothetical protein